MVKADLIVASGIYKMIGKDFVRSELNAGDGH